ncbi:Septin-7 [Fasciola gigantica]|uniref:Septin-7 n=1 Tax=Fasciola gigantica TaxID=46835 RepID=A0A504Z601_FASGI|nr:Septin-7 [Fasciola gigantica]
MGKDNPVVPVTPSKEPEKLSAVKTNQVPSEPFGDAPKTTKRPLIITSQVGFVSLPNQLHRKAVRRGFDFNLMITGSPGLGKSSFTNALFCSDVYNAENPVSIIE